jgi:predicted phosphodiesterase
MTTVLRDFDAAKVSLFGDWHGNLPFAASALTAAFEQASSELYIHVGDFGFWRPGSEESDHPTYLADLEVLLAAQDRVLLFVDGNHEDHLWLREFPIGTDGLREISPHLFHVPRGAAFTVRGKKFVGFGGARSIDRKFRTEGETWFEEELITLEDLEALKLHSEASVLITHEAPEAPWLHGGLGAATEISSDEQRYFVMEARRALSPQLLVHGHHHRNYRTQIGRTIVVGLGCDSWPLVPGAIETNVIHLMTKDLQ